MFEASEVEALSIELLVFVLIFEANDVEALRISDAVASEPAVKVASVRFRVA